MRMMMFAMMMAPLTACTTTGADHPAVVNAKGLCQADSLARFVGASASADSGAAMLRASGARTLRWGGPGMAMTMDFRPDRLTVVYDVAMVITLARCG